MGRIHRVPRSLGLYSKVCGEVTAGSPNLQFSLLRRGREMVNEIRHRSVTESDILREAGERPLCGVPAVCGGSKPGAHLLTSLCESCQEPRQQQPPWRGDGGLTEGGTAAPAVVSQLLVNSGRTSKRRPGVGAGPWTRTAGGLCRRLVSVVGYHVGQPPLADPRE